VRLFLLNASSAREIKVAFADLVAQRASAFLLKTDPFFMTEREQLVALANRHTVPAILFLGLYGLQPQPAQGSKTYEVYCFSRRA
jgi:hypothetical protein